jgi:hypothetical protein
MTNSIKKFALACGLALFSQVACSPAPTAPPAKPEEAPASRKSEIDFQATALPDRKVQFVITTNIPTPVQVMASINLAGQKDDDIWIGHSDKVTLTGPTTTFVLDTSVAQRELPDADYEAEVSYYARWGAEGNPAAEGYPDVKATKTLKLGGGGLTRTAAVRRAELQQWVMLNVIMHTPWDREGFKEKLGRSEKSPSTMSHLHDAYYYPDADMTLLVNRLLGEVTTWRKGRVSE